MCSWVGSNLVLKKVIRSPKLCYGYTRLAHPWQAGILTPHYTNEEHMPAFPQRHHSLCESISEIPLARTHTLPTQPHSRSHSCSVPSALLLHPLHCGREAEKGVGGNVRAPLPFSRSTQWERSRGWLTEWRDVRVKRNVVVWKVEQTSI